MEKELKAILQERGRSIFADPDTLMGLLKEQGCADGQIMTLGLVLKACPSAVNMLQQTQITEAESNVLVSAVVNQTGLSVTAVRRILNTMMTAADIKSTWTPKLLAFERRPQKNLTTLTPEEAEMLTELERALRLPNVSSETIHDLDELSKKGSVRAFYEHAFRLFGVTLNGFTGCINLHYAQNFLKERLRFAGGFSIFIYGGLNNNGLSLFPGFLVFIP